MDTLKHLKLRHKLLSDLVEDMEKENLKHFDQDHFFLATLKKEKLKIKDAILVIENQFTNKM